MKHLRVIVNTHRRPAQALAVVECLRALSSGKHRVSYVLAFDQDDTPSQRVLLRAEAEGENFTTDMRPRPASISDVWNRNLVDPDLADIWLVMPDDGFCAAPDWDDLIVRTMAEAPRPDLAVLGWNDQANPGLFTVPIVAAGWLKAIAPTPLLDPRFPFWFADTAISETWSYVFGVKPPCPEYLLLAGKPGNPNPTLLAEGGDKWWDLYASTRSERYGHAERIRRAQGIPAQKTLAALVAAWIERDDIGRRDTRELVERLRNEGLDNRGEHPWTTSIGSATSCLLTY